MVVKVNQIFADHKIRCRNCQKLYAYHYGNGLIEVLKKLLGSTKFFGNYGSQVRLAL